MNTLDEEDLIGKNSRILHVEVTTPTPPLERKIIEVNLRNDRALPHKVA